MRATRRQIALINPDFVHANTLRAGIVATIATLGTGRKIVWHVHDALPRHPLSSVIRLLACISSRTQVIAVSEATASRFRGSLAFHDRLRVIHNGIDLIRFPLKQPGVSPLKEELGLSKTDFLACAVGQVCPRKGLRELIEAFASIQADVPYLHIAIVGRPVFAHDEAYCNQLIAMTTAYGIEDRVHFSGERSDISALLQSADLLVLNSQEEPFGLVLVEAMSSGTPVLATRVGGIPEIVTDSESGWLVARGDTNALARKLFQLSTDRNSLESVAQFAREVVCPRFTIEAFLAKLHVFYGWLVSPYPSEQPAQVPVLTNAVQDDKGDQHV
jgi:glycosyltransferase involved in cell wall biosynthesis